jgi:hypothetical protein
MVADQDWLAFSISANDFVIVRVSDRYSIGDCHIVANRNTLKAENGAVIIEIAASKLEAGIACDCNLAASVNLKITPNEQSALLANEKKSRIKAIIWPSVANAKLAKPFDKSTFCVKIPSCFDRPKIWDCCESAMLVVLS